MPDQSPTRSYRSSNSASVNIKSDYVQLQFRLPAELRERLSAEANRRAVSVSLLLERAIEDNLDRWERQKI